MKRRNFIRDATFGGLALTGMTGAVISSSGCTRTKVNNKSNISFKNLIGFQPLVLEETQSYFVIKGGTFEYTLNKVAGLITSALVLGDEWLAGPIPDLWASNANDPRTMQYFARFTPSSEVKLVESLPYKVIINSQGLFAQINNTTIPLKYNLLYTFEIDGTVRVDVKVAAERKIVVRWLTLMEGSISKVCSFVSHDFDLGVGSRTCSPTDYDVRGAKEINVGGKYIPWFHFGNDRCGLELVFPNSDRRHGSYTDSSPFPGGDPMGRAYDIFTLKGKNIGLSCTVFGIRNHREVIGPNYSFEDTFFISAVPGRTVRSEANSVQVQWIGPHQFRSNWKHPEEEDIKKWAAGGVNTVVGGANWFSGDYGNCDLPEETKKFLEICHRYGLRVIPYITFTDQEYPTPGFDETGPKWRIEPVTEFNYRSQLMCYGAEGWQEHWQKEVIRIFDQFPFDGLYIDFWAGKVNCYNTDHGCIGPHGRFTVEGLRNMARIAREIVDTKTQNGFILSNTNILPLAMINNWMDARLYGEWHNLENTDPLALRIYYNAHRFGTGNVLLVNKVPKITERTLALSALFQGQPVINHARTSEERSILERNALFLNAFGANQAIALNKFEMEEAIPSQNEVNVPGVSIYYRPDNRDLLVCFSTFAQPASAVQLGPVLKNIVTIISNHLNLLDPLVNGASFYLYAFENKDLIGGKPIRFEEINDYTLDLPPESLRSIWIKPASEGPVVLYALSNGDQITAVFNSVENELVATIPSKARSYAETVVLGPVPKTVKVNDGEVSFKVHKGWWESGLPCNASIRVMF